MITLQHLSYYVQICREKSISGAAKKLYVAQPLLTRILKNMEEELGVTLIKRTSRMFQITNAGNIVKTYGELILKEYDNMLSDIDQLEKKAEGSVYINVAALLIDLYFLECIPEIMEKYPGINLIISHDTSMDPIKSINDGLVDIDISMYPVDEDPFIETEMLIEDELCLVVNKNHIFAKQECVDIKDLKNVPITIFNRATTMYKRFQDACLEAGFSPRIHYECITTDFHFTVIERNETIVGVLPRPLVKENSDVVIVPFKKPIEWKIALVHKKEMSYAQQKVIEEVTTHFNKHTKPHL